MRYGKADSKAGAALDFSEETPVAAPLPKLTLATALIFNLI